MPKRYIRLNDDTIIDTKKLMPHVECYIVKNNHLLQEQISGHIYDLGEIKCMSNKVEEVYHYE